MCVELLQQLLLILVSQCCDLLLTGNKRSCDIAFYASRL